MAIEGKDLLTELQNNARNPAFSRIRYLSRFATEEELVQLFNALLVKAVEGREQNSYVGLERLLADWEDRITQRYASSLAANIGVSQSGEIPWAPVAQPLSKLRFALVTTGGIHLPEQPPYTGFDDFSYRAIPRDTPQERVRATHPGYDVSGPLQDVDCVFPLHRFAELERDGAVGGLAHVNYSFMGALRNPDLVQENASEVAEKLRADGVQAVVLTST